MHGLGLSLKIPMFTYARAARRFFAFLPLLLALLPLHAAAFDPSHGVHGMVLFGDRDGLYAAHLPMFRAPHDNQVVIKLRFKDAQLERDMRTRLDRRTALWTIEPERFALHRLAPDAALPLQGFKANIVEGDFERDGTLRQRQAELLVERVLLYRTLAPQPAVQPVSRYVPVGRFLVKLVDSRPDFDHIVLLERAAAGPVEVAKHGIDANADALARQVRWAGAVYCDTADLQ